MENEEILSVEAKKRICNFLATDDGKALVNAIKRAHEEHLNLAQVLHTRITDPNQQIAVQVSMAAGIKEVLDFISVIQSEVEERKKEEEKQFDA